ncbi:MAG: exosortase-associated EpsI family protein [Verrucomicrobiia bacterium]
MFGRKLVFGMVIGLILGAGGLLLSLKKNQRIGEPGVKVVAVPLNDEGGQPITASSVYLPELSGFESTPGIVQRAVYDYLPKDTIYGQRLYRAAADGFSIACNVVLMGADRTSIHQPQYCLPGDGWRIVSDTTHRVRVGNKELPVNRIVAQRSIVTANKSIVNLSAVLVYCFVTEGEVTANHRDRMWRQAVEQLKTGVLQRWAYVAAYSFCEEGREEETFGRLSQFFSRAAPEFMDVP